MAYADPRPNGRWRGRYRDANGVTQTAFGPNGEKSTKSKREAARWANDVEAKIRAGTWQDPRRGAIPLNEYFHDLWLPRNKNEDQTLSSYLTHWKHIEPTLGAMPINKITLTHVQDWVLDQQDIAMPSTVHSRFGTLATVLGGRKVPKSAVRDGLILVSPCRDVILPPIDPKDIRTYTLGEVEALMKVMHPWWRPVPVFLSETGLRWGEMIGLRVGDFSTDFTTFTVKRTITRLSKKDAAKLGREPGYRVKPKPKNRKPRTITIGQDAATVVAAMVKDRELFPLDALFASRTRDGKQRRTDEWPGGHPIANGSFRSQVWVPAHIEAGIPLRKVHDMRATNLTWLAASDPNLPRVQRHAGHANLSTTQKYLGTMSDDGERLVEALEATKQRFRNG